MATVTFQTKLDVARETPKAVKILGAHYLPKSLVTIEVLFEEVERGTPVQIVNVTMPSWLAKR